MTRKRTISSYDRLAAINTDGVVTSLSFDPKRLSVRIRNGARRMLQSACITGSDKSQTAKVADLLSKAFELGLDRTYGVMVVSTDPELREEVAKIREADFAAWQLEYAAKNINHYYYQYNLDTHKNNLIRHLEQLRTTNTPVHVTFLDNGFKRQAATAMLEQHGGLRARINEAVAALDKGDPIPLPHLND